MTDADRIKELEAEVKRLQAILHNADVTPLAEVATEIAAARENVAGTAALLHESEARCAELLEAAETMLSVLDSVSSYRGRKWEGDAADRIRALLAKAKGGGT